MRIDLKDITNQFVLPLWSQKALNVIDTFMDPSADVQTTFLKGAGPNALKYTAEQIFNAFTPFEFALQETFQDNNKLIYKWKGKAIHTGPVLNINPTGKKIVLTGITSVKIDKSAIVHYHCFSDLHQVLNTIRPPLQIGNLSALYSSDIEHIISTIKEITGKRLTKREVECLKLWLQGFSIKATARHLGDLSHRTIQTFRENIKRKMNVDTYQQLFSLIQANGLINLFL